MKVTLLVIICLLTLYAPLELSRLIIRYGLDIELIGELSIIWVFYLAAMGILIKVVRV